MSISRFWHYEQLMLQLQMTIWKLAPSIYVLPMHVDMVVSSQVYLYLLRFIDPSGNPHLSLMSMYRKNIDIFKLTLTIPGTGELLKSGQKICSKSHLHFVELFSTLHWYQKTANQHGSACEISQTWVLHSNHSPTYLHRLWFYQYVQGHRKAEAY